MKNFTSYLLGYFAAILEHKMESQKVSGPIYLFASKLCHGNACNGFDDYYQECGL